MKTTGTWIKFHLMEKKPKTDVWSIVTNENILLGQIKWFGRWRQYSFFPQHDTVYESKCLTEITAFIKELMRERKKK